MNLSEYFAPWNLLKNLISIIGDDFYDGENTFFWYIHDFFLSVKDGSNANP